MLQLVSSWFTEARVSDDYQRRDYIVLLGLLAVGAVIRFWGLGNVGLHGDEETMAMPAMSILNTGEPTLPSGMHYARGLLQIYMMSASVWLFGESEWAFRLPSALVGSLTGLAAFFMGRRFLAPHFNLAFVATMTFLPIMIEVSQTARMYVFFVTCILWFAACLFRWERDGHMLSLLVALVVWLLALHFHRLSVFAAPLFFFPGLVQQSWRRIIEGGAAAGIGFIIFRIYANFIGRTYPSRSERPPRVEEEFIQGPVDVLAQSGDWVYLPSLLLIGAMAAVAAYRVWTIREWVSVPSVALIVAGLLAMVHFHYHAGGVLLIVGGLFWLRSRELPKSWLLAPVVFVAGLTAIYLGILHESGLFPGRKIIGALVGFPSVWPTLIFLGISPVAAIVYGLFVLVAGWRFVKLEPLPSHVLVFVIGVWIPLLAIGTFVWYMPLRYSLGLLGFFLMCAFAGLAYLMTSYSDRSPGGTSPVLRAAVLAIVAALMINPLALARTVNQSYERWPDHKGAAEYIKGLHLGDDAVLIAEDVLQQFYYLGSVDYSLRPKSDAVIFSRFIDGQVIDQYTAAPVLGSGEELLEILTLHAGQDVYVIGSGENFVGDKRMFREWGIAEVLESDLLDVVFVGRDGRTRVWRLRNQ